jgi:glucose-6-phosphate 1-epimerase
MPAMQTLDDLNARFAVEDALVFEAGEGGLPRAVVRTLACTGEAYLHGAHVTRWRPSGHEDVLWLSPRAEYRAGKAIRGGIPICFPWFAGHKPADRPDAPSHGLVRTAAWRIDATARDGDDTVLTFATDLPPFTLRYTVRFGDALDFALAVTNSSDARAAFEVALHSYFTVGDITRVEVAGLSGADYENTVGGAGTRHTQGTAPLTFAGETDFIYATTSGCTIRDPALSRTIRVDKRGSASTVVWNPWAGKARTMGDFGDDAWPGMLCVEPGNIAPNAVALDPGGSHTTAGRLRVQTAGRADS